MFGLLTDDLSLGVWFALGDLIVYGLGLIRCWFACYMDAFVGLGFVAFPWVFRWVSCVG